MAHKKGMGSSRNGRDSNSQRLGVKAFGGQTVTAGSILVRQRGTRYQPGTNVGLGKDDTLFAKVTGIVAFEPSRRAKSTGKQISVHPVLVAEKDAVTIDLVPTDDTLFTASTEADINAEAQSAQNGQ